MIGLIIVVIVVIILFNSFSKFNRWMKQNEDLLIDINRRISVNPDSIELRFARAEYLMKLQNYHQAAMDYSFVISNEHKLTFFKNEIINNSSLNLEFCNKPLPWSSFGLYDRGGSYWHYQLVERFGNRHVFSARNVLDHRLY